VAEKAVPGADKAACLELAQAYDDAARSSSTVIELSNEFRPHQFTACDLLVEAEAAQARGEKVECYNLCAEKQGGLYNYNEGQLLFLPECDRAGIFRGAESQWTDANSAQDALDRYNKGEMAN
jgi:hypothetical protein